VIGDAPKCVTRHKKGAEKISNTLKRKNDTDKIYGKYFNCENTTSVFSKKMFTHRKISRYSVTK
jgi:hypothetical protein